MAGRLVISDVEKFKSDLVDAIITDWRFQSDRLKEKFEAEIAQMPLTVTQPEFHNPRETKMQAMALALSDINTPLLDLKNAKRPFTAKDDKIAEFSLFDLSITENGKTKTKTIFILPIDSMKGVPQNIDFAGGKIYFSSRMDAFFGRALGYREKIKGGSVYTELHMGHYMKESYDRPDVVYLVTEVYR